MGSETSRRLEPEGAVTRWNVVNSLHDGGNELHGGSS